MGCTFDIPVLMALRLRETCVPRSGCQCNHRLRLCNISNLGEQLELPSAKQLYTLDSLRAPSKLILFIDSSHFSIFCK